MKKLLVTLVIGAFIAASAAGCHTVKGAGKDIEAGGEAVQKAAEAPMK